jgi:hypothetical protein
MTTLVEDGTANRGNCIATIDRRLRISRGKTGSTFPSQRVELAIPID